MAPKMMDLTEFQKSGLLQEINRKFLHVLGLAMAVSVNEEGKVVAIVGLIDNRADQQGMVFSNVGKEHQLRADNVEREFQRRARIRQAALGYVVQPVGSPPPPPAPTGHIDLGDGAVEIVAE